MPVFNQLVLLNIIFIMCVCEYIIEVNGCFHVNYESLVFIYYVSVLELLNSHIG